MIVPTISANPKTFIVLFLTFWYVVVNDAGATAAFDFAGFQGAATWRVTFVYLAAAVASAVAAALWHRQQRARA